MEPATAPPPPPPRSVAVGEVEAYSGSTATDPLPAGWSKAVDANGRTYYYSGTQTQWVPPATDASAPAVGSGDLGGQLQALSHRLLSTFQPGVKLMSNTQSTAEDGKLTPATDDDLLDPNRDNAGRSYTNARAKLHNIEHPPGVVIEADAATAAIAATAVPTAAPAVTTVAVAPAAVTAAVTAPSAAAVPVPTEATAPPAVELSSDQGDEQQASEDSGIGGQMVQLSQRIFSSLQLPGFSNSNAMETVSEEKQLSLSEAANAVSETALPTVSETSVTSSYWRKSTRLSKSEAISSPKVVPDPDAIPNPIVAPDQVSVKVTWSKVGGDDERHDFAHDERKLRFLCLISCFLLFFALHAVGSLHLGARHHRQRDCCDVERLSSHCVCGAHQPRLSLLPRSDWQAAQA